ncbi:transcriptional regulator [Burkholderia stagnalis]|nr:helix-turn-helix transcriptional regulator [Burkholderia stagnalis]MBN3750817.1 transcriptional regulator [Burkholderia sp. Se-20373]RQY09575.1 transcriptional regulator [Burkholderia stagnalis]RQY87835.1 transcriptional regulator [Burkholderia stagnalis]RQY95081.1 transcriptional regulator [Burkholderia stagnalis]
MVDYAEFFAAAMRRRREELGLAQEALGATLGLDRNSISRLERGSLNISLDKAKAIAEALGVSLGSLLGDPAPASNQQVQTRFGERVRSLRTEHGLKQRELAERMGVDRNLVSGIESGKRSATLRTLQLFCQGLRVNPSDLL